MGPVGLQAVKAQEHVHGLPRPVWDPEGLEGAAEGDDAAGQGPGGQGVELYGSTVRHKAEGDGRRHENTFFLVCKMEPA